jgi:hypothetical protein
MIYHASNNVLVYATFAAEVTESGIHVGRGMGFHYHAFSTEVTQTDGPDDYTYDQQFLQRGAFKGLVNDIPGLFQVSTSQLMEDDYKRYVGGEGTVVVGTDNTASNQIPEFISISQDYPNPFNPTTTIRYDLQDNGLVNIAIFDTKGSAVKTLINDQQTAGYKSIQWNATDNLGQPVSAGLYLYTIQAGEFRQTKKIVLLNLPFLQHQAPNSWGFLFVG